MALTAKDGEGRRGTAVGDGRAGLARPAGESAGGVGPPLTLPDFGRLWRFSHAWMGLVSPWSPPDVPGPLPNRVELVQSGLRPSRYPLRWRLAA